jgi:hypothetical protein
VTLDERVRARLDEMQQAADQGVAWVPESAVDLMVAAGHAGDITAPYIASENGSWAREVWLPSLRRRAERHGPRGPEVLGLVTRTHCAAGCSGVFTAADGYPSIGPVDWPCPDYRDLCAEVGVEVDAPQRGGTT